LGGLILTAGVTNTGFRQILDILLVISADYVVQNEHGDEVLIRDAQPLLPGNYIVATNEVLVNLSVKYLPGLLRLNDNITLSHLRKEFDQYLFSINPDVSFLSSTLFYTPYLLNVLNTSRMDTRLSTFTTTYIKRVEAPSIVAYSTTHSVRQPRSSAGISARPSSPI